MNDTRKMAIWGLCSMGGLIGGALLWKQHRFWGGFLGYGIGAGIGTVVTGYSPVAAFAQHVAQMPDPGTRAEGFGP